MINFIHLNQILAIHLLQYGIAILILRNSAALHHRLFPQYETIADI
jgi:hypothetical protein